MVEATQGGGPDERAVFAGVSTPLSDILLPDTVVGPVLVIVSTVLGTLSADITGGAAVRGSGSGTLWISGSVSEVNAKLATLSYSGRATGSDTLTLTLLDATGALSAPARVPLAIVPLRTPESTPLVAIDHGTITLDTRMVDGPGLALTEIEGSRGATTAVLVNTTLGARSTLSIRNNNPLGGVMPRLAVAGRVELDGPTSLSGNGTAVTIAQNGTLLNAGSMLVSAHAAQFTGTGTLINDGSVVVAGDGSAEGTVRIDTAVGGTGQIALTDRASLSLRSVASTETVSFGDGAQTLHLAQPAAFGGVIAGFSRADAIVLDGVTATNAFFSTTAGTTAGTLALFNGRNAIADLLFSGVEAGTVFQLVTDGSGASSIRLAAVPSATPAADTTVYRFFDAAHGTQLLTDSQAERDEIIGTRSDLHYEGIAFGAVSPASADADTVPVYRFFDTVNGTHLLTASATERDTLLGTRPDLVFEPNSTMFEHTSARADDVAVYRFFDQGSGAHFLTGDASERATILATRPDLTPEGIAFYAPRL